MCNTTNSTKNKGSENLPSWRIAVVGGGPAGISFCIQLFDKICQIPNASGRRIEVNLFEKSGQIGPGMAYAKLAGPFSDTQLLNEPTDGMTASLGKFGQFSEWIRRMAPSKIGEWPSGIEQNLYPPRYVFGEYLVHLAEKLRKDAANHPAIRFQFHTNKAVQNIEKIAKKGDNDKSINEFRLEMHGEDGKFEILADQIILCTGHLPEDTYRHLIHQSPRYVHNQWTRERAFSQMDPRDPIGIVGARLTAVDLCLELRARGHSGPIFMCSRTGLLPGAFSPLKLLACRKQKLQNEEEFLSPLKAKLDGNDEEIVDLINAAGREKKGELMETLWMKNPSGHPSKTELVFLMEKGDPKKLTPIEIVPKQFLPSSATENGMFIAKQKMPILSDLNNNQKLLAFEKKLSEVLLQNKIPKNDDREFCKKLAELIFVEIASIAGPRLCPFRTIDLAIENVMAMSAEKWLDLQLAVSGNGRLSPWQLAIYSLYPALTHIWQEMDEKERRIYFQKYNAIFESFSGAMPLPNARRIRSMLAEGQLKVLCDLKPIQWNENGQYFSIGGKIRMDDGNKLVRTNKVKWLFNATGSGFSPLNVPVLASLIRNGLAKEHPFGGFHVHPDTLRILKPSSLISGASGEDKLNDSNRLDSIFAIGQLTKGDLLMTSEMYKVVQQADQIAAFIVDTLF